MGEGGLEMNTLIGADCNVITIDGQFGKALYCQTPSGKCPKKMYKKRFDEYCIKGSIQKK